MKLSDASIVGFFVVIFTLFDGVNPLAAGSKEKVFVHTFDGVYEPSAVVTLPDNTIVVFEDEGEDCLSLYRVVTGGKGPMLKRVEAKLPQLKVRDIEGAAVVGEHLFALTSHSLNKKGERKKKREQLLIFAFADLMRVKYQGDPGLHDRIAAYLKKFYAMADEEIATLNVESLVAPPGGDRLLLGLRYPLKAQDTILIPLRVSQKIGSKTITAELIQDTFLLGMDGAGVRAMTYDPVSRSYYLANETRNKKGKMRSRLWGWTGHGRQPYPLKIKGLKKLKNIEGATIVTHGGKRLLLVVCDDGRRDKKKGASYGLIEIDSLRRGGR